MPESLVEIWSMILLWGKTKPVNQHFAVDLTQVWPLKFMLVFVFHENISVALKTYLKLKHDTFG